jgi:hypothetical protein
MKAVRMAWIKENKKAWRAALLVVGVVALLGPWVFDLIWVPAEYNCSAPYMRLDGDYCGKPLLGILVIGWLIGGLVSSVTGLVLGTMTFIEWVRESLYSLFLFLLILPLVSTLFLILRGDGLRQCVFSIAAWGLSASIGLLIGLYSYPRLFWALWGLWLYVALAVVAVVLEVRTMAAIRKSSNGNRS